MKSVVIFNYAGLCFLCKGGKNDIFCEKKRRDLHETLCKARLAFGRRPDMAQEASVVTMARGRGSMGE